MLKISKNTKKIALSLLVIGLAIGAQSFKNAEKKFVDTRYITGYNSSNSTYSFQTADPGVCIDTPTANPCQITTKTGYPALPASGTLPASDVNDPAKISKDSYRNSY